MRQNSPASKFLINRINVKPLAKKYSAGYVGQIRGITRAILGPHEGRFAIVTKRRAGDVMDAAASGALFCVPDENAGAYGQVVWS